MNTVLLMTVFWKIIDTVIAILAPRVIPYLGHFSHPKTLLLYSMPGWGRPFANFDGIFYLRIARDGYSQYEQAFFPLFPLLIRLSSIIFAHNLMVTGFVITSISFIVGILLFYQFLILLQVKSPKTVIFFLLAFPTSFFFRAMYTESVFFLLTVLTFYLYQKGYKKWAALTAACASATRLVGVFLCIPFVIDGIRALRQKKPDVKKAAAYLFGALCCGGGLFVYMAYLAQSTGNPFAFIDSQTAFGAGRSTSVVLLPQVYFRYLKILLINGVNLPTFISLLEVSIFTVVFFTILYELWRKRKTQNPFLSLHLFSLANILFPTLSGTFLSIPRFALLSLSFFIIVGSVERRLLQTATATAFIFLHSVLLILFIQGYFVS